MASGDHQAALLCPFWIACIDLQPESQVEAPLSSWEQLREFKAALCRDLSALLNTRRAEQDFDPAYEEATNSLLSFGIADFTSYNLKSGVEQEQVRRSIERAIRQFEPRLARVSVSIEEPDPVRPGAAVSNRRAAAHRTGCGAGRVRRLPAPRFAPHCRLRRQLVIDELLPYYERELKFIRQMAGEFAEKYPKVAGRLLLQPDTCEDPHVERLIEAFALLAGQSAPQARR